MVADLDDSTPHSSCRISHMEVLRADARDEIKRRIAERGAFSGQLVLAVTSSLAVAAAGGDRFIRVLLAVPPAVAFFVLMILHSCRIHEAIVGYLRWELEPRLSAASGTPLRLEWETYYGARHMPGLHKGFYRAVLVLCAISFPAIVAIAEKEGLYFWLAICLGLGYLVGAGAVCVYDSRLSRRMSSRLRRFALRSPGTPRWWPPRQRHSPSRRIAVFVGRDGTINEEARCLDDLREPSLIEGAIDGLKLLASLDVFVIVVTNQAGIALGKYELSDARRFNRKLMSRISRSAGRVDAVYFCPESEDGLGSAGLPDSSCSKPNPGMLQDAAADFDLDLPRSFIVSNKVRDLVAGRALGCTTILVSTSQGGLGGAAGAVDPDYQAGDFSDAAKLIRSQVMDPAPLANPTV
ncbi:MAG: HAD-IIIA family hydrolase [Actinobacteria bacterium]|nr:HAD-IIIA family hydrolase [Actinomycetota bacterium]